MATDFEETLRTIQARQWALADFDWEAAGADQITDAQRPKLAAFMADLVWIENIGARGFAALAKKAPNPTLATIYRYFHAEEQRHANAELALMHRWGMLEAGAVPEPSIQVRLAIEWLDRYADEMPLSALGASEKRNERASRTSPSSNSSCSSCLARSRHVSSASVCVKPNEWTSGNTRRTSWRSTVANGTARPLTRIVSSVAAASVVHQPSTVARGLATKSPFGWSKTILLGIDGRTPSTFDRVRTEFNLGAPNLGSAAAVPE